jgi:hypothetical protein
VLATGIFSGPGGFATNTFSDTGVLTNRPTRFYIIQSP